MRLSSVSVLLVFAAILVASVFYPGPMIVFLVANTIVVVVLALIQIFVALLPRLEPKRRTAASHSMVSIVVPAFNEPPAMVMHTLEALSGMRYGNFEVVVIDNNTKDPAVWKPVQRFVDTLGDTFRFFHVENLGGFKAGALNYALGRLNPASEYVAVIDADYVVEPDFLVAALSYFTDRQIGLVQFPQQYHNCTKRNQAIADEYRHFFKIYMNMANHLDCVPSSGTVSVYRKRALEEVGGFRGDMLTEDADVGLRIHGAGYNGVYVDRTVGYGLMPYDFEAYRKQKWRWAFGNAQTLRALFGLWGKIPFRSWFGFFAHLTAWDHLNFLPFAVLGAYSIVLLPSLTITQTHRGLLTVASLSIFATLLSKLILFVVALRRQKRPLSRSVKAFLVHMSMTLVYSEAWIASLFQSRVPFERTNKFILAKMPGILKNSYKELLLGCWFLVGAMEAMVWGTRTITLVAFFVSALTLFSVYYTYWKIFPTKAHSQNLLLYLERKYRHYLLTG